MTVNKFVYRDCRDCGDTYKSTKFASRAKWCKPCAAERRADSKKARNDKISAEAHRVGRIDRGHNYEVTQTTEQFRRGSTFSQIDVDYMLKLGSFLEGTRLTFKDRQFVVKSIGFRRRDDMPKMKLERERNVQAVLQKQ